MKKLLIVVLVSFTSLAGLAQDQTTFILVRHAEKSLDGSNNPPLSGVGLSRANELAAILQAQDIDALFSTPYIRTEATLTPLARAKGMEVQTYDPYDGKDLLSKILKDYQGGTVVISGHSNTIPDLANSLLGTKKFTQFDDNDYANLLIIVTSEIGKGKLVWLKY